MDQIYEQDDAGLRSLWQTAGASIEAPDGSEDAKYKLVLQKMIELWMDHCLVIAIDQKDGQPRKIRASCWHFCQHGHCPHFYAVQQLEGQATYVSPQVPSADASRGVLPKYDDAFLGSSDNEATASNRARRSRPASSHRTSPGRKRENMGLFSAGIPQSQKSPDRTDFCSCCCHAASKITLPNNAVGDPCRRRVYP